MTKRMINNKEQTIVDFFTEYHLAKAKIYKLLTTSSVLVNGVVATVATKVYPQDKIAITFDDIVDKTVALWDFNIEIVYEDDDILLVNKPAGILIHSDGLSLETLTSAVNFYLKKKKNFLPAYCIHRLDLETMGLVLFAKNPLALAHLSFQMENMQITKKYVAVVEGIFNPLNGIIDLNIGRNRHINNCYRVASNGKSAVTTYQTLQSSKQKSVVVAEIITGRTHQIRVHFSHLHHPIIGDKIYGKTKGKLMLFSQALKFIHPQTKQEFYFELDIPGDFMVNINEQSN